MNERETQLFLGCKQGLELFRVATDEQAKEIKKEYFGTDNNFALMDIFKKIMNELDPHARDVIWNTLLVELDLQDVDATMEQILDMARAKMTYDSVPILNWGLLQPLPRVVHDPIGGDYTITEIEPEPIPCLPADPTNTRPIPMTNHPIRINTVECQVSSQQQ